MNYEILTYVNSILNKKSYIEISNDNLNLNKYMKLLSVYLIYVLYIYMRNDSDCDIQHINLNSM